MNNRPSAQASAKEAFARETLRQEAMELMAQQRAIADKGTRALAFGFTVLAGFAAYGVAGKGKGHELLLRALPVAVALIGIELLQNFAAEGAMAEARKAIEDALTDHVGTHVLVYDKYVRLLRQVNWSGIVVAAVFLILYICVVCLTQIPDAPTGKNQLSPSVSTPIVWVARGATAVTFAGLIAIAIGVFNHPRAVKDGLKDNQIDLSQISASPGETL